VLGVIVHADTQWRSAEQAVKQILESVPNGFKQDFIFHAMTIWGSKKYHDGWGMQDRLAMLRQMMSVPRRLKLPISLGIAHRNVALPTQFRSDYPLKMPKEQFQHVLAFFACVALADRYLRRCHDPDEVATIVAEDVPSMRRFLRAALELARSEPIFNEATVRLTRDEKIDLSDPRWAISRIIDTVHFVEKSNGPLLQVADACAYGFRRLFAKQKHGDEFSESILGEILDINEYSKFCCGQLFCHDTY
jgi:hypothetical protein